MTGIGKPCAACGYVPVEGKGNQTRRDRTCGEFWFCSFFCHKRFHAWGAEDPRTDPEVYTCENEVK